MQKRLQRKFMPKDMEQPDEHYGSLAARIFYAECYASSGVVEEEKVKAYAKYLKGKCDEEPEWTDEDERLRTKLKLEQDDFGPMINSVITIDRCFHKLLLQMEPLGALALVRMQIDNLKHIYAETKYPGRVLYKIYEKGRDLNQVKIGGKAINSSELIDELDSRYGRVKDMWRTYCQFVHPSKGQQGIEMRSYFSYMRLKEVPTPNAIKYFSWDMVYVNMLITSVLFHHLDSLIKKVKENGNYGKYLHQVHLLNEN